MLVEVYLGHKRPATLPLKIREKKLTLKGDMDIRLRPTTITTITKVNLVDC